MSSKENHQQRRAKFQVITAAEDHYQGCSRKRVYHSERIAYREGALRPVPLRAYKCKCCHLWHLTSQV